MKYAYRVLDVFRNEVDLQTVLNRMAEQGWRLVAAWEGTAILERVVMKQMYAIFEPGGERVPMIDSKYLDTDQTRHDPDA